MFFQLNFFKTFFLLLLRILITSEVDPIFFDMNSMHSYYIDKSLKSYKSLLTDIMHGKIPFKIETPSNLIYDIDFIERINGNFPVPYMLKSLELDEHNNGIFLGCGINLINFEPEEMEKILKEAKFNPMDIRLIKSFCKVSGNEAKLLINNNPFIFMNIRKFNEAVLNYLINNKTNSIFPNKNNNLKTPFINGFFSLYIQLEKNNPHLKGYFFNNYTSASYITKYFFEGAPFARFIQSKLILMMEGNIKFNNNHLVFVVPMIFDEKEKLSIKTFITEYFRNLNNNFHLNKNIISVLTFNEEVKNYVINYNSRKSRQLENIFEFNKREINPFNLTQIYEYLLLLFEEFQKTNKANIFQNKIVVLFLDMIIAKKYDLNDIINEYKKKGIQTITYINKSDSRKIYDLIDYNIFYNFSNTFEIAPLRIEVSNMHINIDLTDVDQNSINTILKKLYNLKMNDIDAPLYIEVNIIREENDFVFYEISLEIMETQGYNIFLSDNNPYPNIKDYTSKFIKYDNNFNPKLRIKTKSLNQFYIAIEGILSFNLVIKKNYLRENTELILSEGEFHKESYNIPITFTDDTIRNLETFRFDYKPKLNSNVLRANSTLDYVIKYYTRGIDLDNTDYNSFFDYNLFSYLFENFYIINTVYRNADTNKYYIGKFFELNNAHPFRLLDEGLNQLIINKLYDFINENYKTLNSTNLPAISFNEEETRLIYNVTNKKNLLNIVNLLNKTSNTKDFDDLSSETKFIILCLYFQNSRDNLEYIKILAQNEPKYPEILKSFMSKEKRDDRANRFIISSISSFDQQIKFEKILITLVIGQSFILTDEGINFIKDFYNVLSKAKAKISLQVYDTVENKIETVIPFYSKKVTRVEIIDEYREENEDIKYKYNQTNAQEMDFNKIIDFGLDYFDKYDIGIKKELFIISDENLNTSDKFYVNNILKNLNYEKHVDLRKHQIKLILLSTKNVEKGDIPELFTLQTNTNEDKPYTINENYFHVRSFHDTNLFINDLAKMAKDAIIKLDLGTRLINDFFQGKINYYEIHNKDLLTDIIVIKANISNFNFYYSFDNPFPNQYMDRKADKMADDNKIVISDINREKIYLGIESKNEVKKQIIEIFSCETYYSKDQYKNCKFVENNRLLWYAFILFVAIFIIGLAVYYFGHSNDKTRINIFQQ